MLLRNVLNHTFAATFTSVSGRHERLNVSGDTLTHPQRGGAASTSKFAKIVKPWYLDREISNLGIDSHRFTPVFWADLRLTRNYLSFGEPPLLPRVLWVDLLHRKYAPMGSVGGAPVATAGCPFFPPTSLARLSARRTLPPPARDSKSSTLPSPNQPLINFASIDGSPIRPSRYRDAQSTSEDSHSTRARDNNGLHHPPPPHQTGRLLTPDAARLARVVDSHTSRMSVTGQTWHVPVSAGDIRPC